MSDGEVLDEVDRIKRRARRAVRAANRRLKERESEARFCYRGSDDVEQAARHNAIRRAEILCESELERARGWAAAELTALRQRAGKWADLVPAWVP